MTDERRKLARELLAAATPGLWESSPIGEKSGFEAVFGDGMTVAQWCVPRDAALIAAAPDLLREALDELDRRDREDEEIAEILDGAGL